MGPHESNVADNQDSGRLRKVPPCRCESSETTADEASRQRCNFSDQAGCEQRIASIMDLDIDEQSKADNIDSIRIDCNMPPCRTVPSGRKPGGLIWKRQVASEPETAPWFTSLGETFSRGSWAGLRLPNRTALRCWSIREDPASRDPCQRRPRDDRPVQRRPTPQLHTRKTCRARDTPAGASAYR